MPAVITYTMDEESLAAAAAAVGEQCDGLSFWDAAGAGVPPAGGNLMMQIDLSNNPDALTLGQMLELAMDQFEYTQNEASDNATGFIETNYWSERKAEGAISGGIWIQFHDGAQGAAGTGNVMNLARVQMEEANFSIARS